jgi:hypothetical protein
MRPMFAILIDAVRCFQRNFEVHHPDSRQEFREAQLWIFDDTGNGPFSFEEVCYTLGIGVSAAGLISGSGSYVHLAEADRISIEVAGYERLRLFPAPEREPSFNAVTARSSRSFSLLDLQRFSECPNVTSFVSIGNPASLATIL